MKNKNDFTELLEDLIGESPTAGEIIRAFRENWKVTLRELEDLTGIKDNNLSDALYLFRPISRLRSLMSCLVASSLSTTEGLSCLFNKFAISDHSIAMDTITMWPF